MAKSRKRAAAGRKGGKASSSKSSSASSSAKPKFGSAAWFAKYPKARRAKGGKRK